MITVLGLVLFFTLNVEEARSLETIPPVNVAIWPQWMEGMVNYHLTKMTAELYRDSATKMKTVVSNSKMYEKNSMFAIGQIASNLYTSFDKMIKIYQDVSLLHKVRNRDITWSTAIKDPLMAFGVCQSLYHSIRLEKKLFDEVMQKQAKDQAETMEAVQELHGSMPEGRPGSLQVHKGGMYVARKSNIDDLFDEEDFDRNFEIPIIAKLNKESKPLKSKQEQTVKRPIPVKKAPRSQFAPLPLDPKPPGTKNSDSKLFKLEHILKALPPDFLQEHPKPSILKLQAQLNKDNPKLNPDLDGLLNRQGYRPRVKDSDELNEPNPFPSRRKGSDSHSDTPSRRSGQSTVPSQKTSSSYTVKTKSIKSESHAPQLWKSGSKNIPVGPPSRNFDVPVQSQSRRMGLNSYSLKPPMMIPDSFAPQAPRKPSNNYSVGPPKLVTDLPSRSRNKSANSNPISQPKLISEDLPVQSRRKISNSYPVGPPKLDSDHSSIQSRRLESNSYPVGPRKLDSNDSPIRRKLGSNSYPVVPPIWSFSNSYFSKTEYKRPRYQSKKNQDRFDNQAKANNDRVLYSSELEDYSEPLKRSKNSVRKTPKKVKKSKRQPIANAGVRTGGAPVEGRRAFNSRGRMTTTTRPKLLIWQPRH